MHDNKKSGLFNLGKSGRMQHTVYASMSELKSSRRSTSSLCAHCIELGAQIEKKLSAIVSILDIPGLHLYIWWEPL